VCALVLGVLCCGLCCLKPVVVHVTIACVAAMCDYAVHDVEWNYGGLPVWLNWIEGIVFRGSNAQWEYYMQNFVTLIANMMEPYLARNGGPIIMAQIENEYHGSDWAYVDWCGNLTVQLDLDIPW
jgi:hypothetical protein